MKDLKDLWLRLSLSHILPLALDDVWLWEEEEEGFGCTALDTVSPMNPFTAMATQYRSLRLKWRASEADTLTLSTETTKLAYFPENKSTLFLLCSTKSSGSISLRGSQDSKMLLFWSM